MQNPSSQTQFNFKQVDVFSAQAFMGNPLAVVLGADGWSDAQMQRFANWTNLSETTFLLAPTHPHADYKVRIFTTTQEFPFAGHPTLGSCHAWLEAGGVPHNAGEVVQECGAGLVKIKRQGDRLAFAARADDAATTICEERRDVGVADERKRLAAPGMGVQFDEYWVHGFTLSLYGSTRVMPQRAAVMVAPPCQSHPRPLPKGGEKPPPPPAGLALAKRAG